MSCCCWMRTCWTWTPSSCLAACFPTSASTTLRRAPASAPALRSRSSLQDESWLTAEGQDLRSPCRACKWHLTDSKHGARQRRRRWQTSVRQLDWFDTEAEHGKCRACLRRWSCCRCGRAWSRTWRCLRAGACWTKVATGPAATRCPTPATPQARVPSFSAPWHLSFLPLLLLLQRSAHAKGKEWWCKQARWPCFLQAPCVSASSCNSQCLHKAHIAALLTCACLTPRAGGAGAAGAAGAGGEGAGGSGSGKGGMWLALSQVQEWVLEFCADMLYISIRTDVAWYRLTQCVPAPPLRWHGGGRC